MTRGRILEKSKFNNNYFDLSLFVYLLEYSRTRNHLKTSRILAKYVGEVVMWIKYEMVIGVFSLFDALALLYEKQCDLWILRTRSTTSLMGNETTIHWAIRLYLSCMKWWHTERVTFKHTHHARANLVYATNTFDADNCDALCKWDNSIHYNICLGSVIYLADKDNTATFHECKIV